MKPTSAAIEDLARRIAREFHDMEKDAEFHRIWPSPDNFVALNWQSFRDAARKMMAEHDEEEFIIVNGEQIDKTEAMELLRGLYHEAEEAAGEAHGKDRSEKFRKNWPDEYLYAKANWKSYVQEARKRYAQKLADPRTHLKEQRRIHMALVLEFEISRGQERDNRLQLGRGTQQFEGDPFENRKIIDQFGKQSNTFKDLLLSSSARRFH